MNEFIARLQEANAADSEWVRFEVEFSLQQRGAAISDKQLSRMQEAVAHAYKQTRELLGNAK